MSNKQLSNLLPQFVGRALAHLALWSYRAFPDMCWPEVIFCFRLIQDMSFTGCDACRHPPMCMRGAGLAPIAEA